MKNALKAILLFILAYGNADRAFAQEAPLKLSYSVNTDHSVDFRYDKTDPGTFTLVMNFKNLTNSYDSGPDYTANFYSGKLLTLTPTNKDQGIGFSYTYTFIRGKLIPKYKTDFVYLLPYQKGIKVKVVEASFVNAKYFGSTTPDDWKAYSFYTEKQDTVTAIRKGTVVEIKDLYETENLDNYVYKSSVNELIIEHADGSLATYRGFKKGSFAVRVGQTVFPGTPLGVNTRYSSSSMYYSMSLMLTYLKTAYTESAEPQTFKNAKSYYGFITPKFYTAENAGLVLVPQQDYVVADSPEIIRKEFTKKELKLAAK